MQNIVTHFNIDVDYLFFDFRKISSTFKIWRYIVKNEVNNVIVGTAQGCRALRFFILPFPSRINFCGIIHDTEKILKSRGQKIICKKLDGYYTLAEYIYRPEKKKLKSQYIETAFYPFCNLVDLNKKTNETWIAIPGAVEYQRRDYDFLLTLAKHPALSENIKFILLGNTQKRQESLYFIKKISEQSLEHRFIYFTNYIDAAVFHSYIATSDYLFPLIHPATHDAKNYMKYKISGMFPFAQFYNKTMLATVCFQLSKILIIAHFFTKILMN
jgi:hypothetical protein